VQTEKGILYDAEIVGLDERTDLGVVRIKATGLPKAEFGNSDALRVGDSVFAIGNPGNKDTR
jgi:serine protease Do